MQKLPDVTIRAAARTAVKAKLDRVEIAGIMALQSDMKQIEHQRRQLAMKDQELQTQRDETLELFREAWREVCSRHNLDPNVPVEHWTLNQKKRIATLDPVAHPLAEPRHDGHHPSNEPADPRAPRERAAGAGADGPDVAVGGHAGDGPAGDD